MKFSPTVRRVKKKWQASIKTGIGTVHVDGRDQYDARLRLWLVLKAIQAFESRPHKAMKDWTEDEWRSALSTIAKVIG